MNYNLQAFTPNKEIVDTLLSEVPLSSLAKKLGVSVTTISKYQKDPMKMINAPYKVTYACLKEAIKFNEYKKRNLKIDYSEFSKICIFIENGNENLCSARILLSKTYLDRNSASLNEISHRTHIAYSTLKAYQTKRIDLADASWKKVHELAVYKKALDLSDAISKTLIEKMLKNEQEI